MLEDGEIDLLISWEEALKAGQETPLAELCRDDPALLPELEESVLQLRQVGRYLDSGKADAPPHYGASPAPDRDRAEDTSIPRSLGRYQPVARLGSGGVARVWKAYDPQLCRYVAVKYPRGSVATSSDACEAFLKEARKLAQLDIPGIVRVYDVGHEGSAPYIVTEIIDGPTLGQYAHDHALDVATCVAIVAEVADTLHAAHARGIIHLDVKPSNIFIDADGKPHVGDFGISLSPGVEGEVATASCTPAYAAPEQVRFDERKLGPATDVFSLGVVLYQLLTGQLPFGKQGVFGVSSEATPAIPRPSTVNPTLSPRFDEVCLRALAMEPADRFVSAEQFAQALRKCLRTGERKRRWVYVPLAVAFVVLVLVVWWRDSFVNALSGSSRADLAAEGAAASQESAEFKLVGHRRVPQCVAVAADRPLAVSTSRDKTVRVWDLTTQRELGQPRHEGAAFIYEVAADAAGKLIAGAGNDGVAYLWEWPALDPVCLLRGHGDKIICLAMTGDGRQLVTGGADRTVRVWDLAARRLATTLSRLPGRPHDLAVSPDGQWVVVACPDIFAGKESPVCTSVWLCPLTGAAQWREFRGHTGYVWAVAVSPDGRQIASGAGGVWRPNGYNRGDDNQVILWDVGTGNVIRRLDVPGDGFSNLMFTPDGTRLIGQFKFDPRKARGPEDAFSLGVWDLRTGRVLQRLVSGEAVCCTLDGRSVIYSDANAVMRMIELAAASGASVPP